MVFSLIVSMSFAFAEDEEVNKVVLAYDCLQNKINNTCGDLTLEQQIFSLMVLDDCKAEVKESQDENYCWPKDKCETKKTAQAILALDASGTKTEKAEEWLMSQNKTPTDLIWYLQVESPEATSCEISYGSSTHTVNIAEDKKIDSSAGNCLSLAQSNYWLEIYPSCYDYEFEISCDKDFQTNLLYKESDSITIHVSPETSSSSEGGITKEKINSLCFKQGNSCNYEASLWAAWVLNLKGYDVSAYMPYLITQTKDNERYLPESFLLLLGEESYKTALLEKQKTQGYWRASTSTNEYYDTALALLPLYSEELSEKDKALEWLLESQDSEGCWQGNIRNTAFILFSAWPEKGPSRDKDGDGNGDDTDVSADCEKNGGFCMYQSECEESGGNELTLLDCFGSQVCCDTEVVLKTCEEEGGKICADDEECSISTTETLDEYYCCLGTCKEKQEEPEESKCKQQGGICKSTCNESEEINYLYNCESSVDNCCVSKESPKSNLLWVWILLILIVLVSVGIIFRDNLRKFWFRAKSGFSKSKPGPRGEPGFFHSPMRRPATPRRIFPPSDNQMRRLMPRRPSKELDDVLGKLKQMGK